MARYIDADDVLKHQRKMRGFGISSEDDFWDYAVLVEDIQKTPTADVVEVVRCKDCEHYTEDCEDRYGNKFGRCDHPQQDYDIECYDMWVETKPNDFCSYGERKDGDTR